MKRPLKFLAALVLIVGCGSHVWAAEAYVRSGEHDGFSRLVLHLPFRTGWALSGEGRERRLTLDKPVDWDLREALARIPGDRVRRVAALSGASGLRLDLNCPCKLEVFWHRDSMLVIDVQDPGYPLKPETSSNPAVQQLNLALRARLLGDATAENPGLQSGPGGIQEQAVRLATDGLERAMRSDGIRNSAESDIVRAIRQAIAWEISRAASIGLVEISPDGRRATRSDGKDVPDRPAATTAERPGQLPVHANILAHNSSMRIANTASSDPGRHSAQCTPDEFLAVSEWGTAAPYALQLGAARRALFAEGREEIENASLALARLYIFFGFGAEAAQIVEDAKLTDEASAVAFALARLLEYDKPDTSVFDGQTDCQGHVALWAMLASDEAATDQYGNVDSALRSLASLPVHLRNLLGPKLAKLFRSEGRADAADRALRITSRSSEEEPGFVLEKVRTAAMATALPGSETALLELVRGNSDKSPLALAELMKRRLEKLDTVPADWVDLAGAYVHEQDGSNVGKTLRPVWVAALAAAGHYKRAFDELDRLSMTAGPVTTAQTGTAIARYAVNNADDITFLKLLGYRNPPLPLPGSTQNDVARRLIQLGFPNEALDYISGDTEPAGQEARRLLRGEAALARSEPLEAIASLMGMEGQEADTIRARANSLLKPRQAGDPKTANLQGTPIQDDLSGTGPIGAQQVEPKPESLPSDPIDRQRDAETTGALAIGAELLQESETVRQSIKDLLDTVRSRPITD